MRACVLVILLAIAGVAQAAQDRALFWKVQGPQAVVYLLGSIHAADASFYPLRDEIESAFESADHLVVEINMNAASIDEYRRLTRLKGLYSGSATIRDALSPATYQALVEHLDTLGIPVSSIEKQKPGLLAMTLSSLQFERLGYSPSLGIDLYFLDRARGIKSILELESVNEQLDIFLGFDHGELLLEETLDTLKASGQRMRDLVRSWKQGDASRLQSLLLEASVERKPEFEAVYDRLITERNVRMVEKIETYLRTREVYFVVVGAGHLVGDSGLPALLARNHEVLRL